VGIFVQWPLKAENNLSTASSNDKFIWVADINEVMDQAYMKIKIETSLSSITASSKSKQYTTCITKNKKRGF